MWCQGRWGDCESPKESPSSWLLSQSRWSRSPSSLPRDLKVGRTEGPWRAIQGYPFCLPPGGGSLGWCWEEPALAGDTHSSGEREAEGSTKLFDQEPGPWERAECLSRQAFWQEVQSLEGGILH